MTNQQEDGSLGKLVLRLTVGGLMLFHGVAKMMHPESLDFIGKSLTDVGLPLEMAYGVYVGEVLGPLMIILGIYASIGGVMVLVNMAFAVYLVHMADLLVLTQHGGWKLELQAFFLLGGLAIALLGSGRFAIKPD